MGLCALGIISLDRAGMVGLCALVFISLDIALVDTAFIVFFY